MATLADSASTLGDMFRARVKVGGEAYREKIGDSWVPVQWERFAREVDSIAEGLIATGIGRGDTIAILGHTGPTWCAIDMAAIVIGATTVGIYDTLMADQIQYILEDCGARAMFVQGEEAYERVKPLLASVDKLQNLVVWDHSPDAVNGVQELTVFRGKRPASGTSSSAAVREAAGTVTPEDVALIVYTSGTTGNPKGVPLTHGNVLSQLRAGGQFAGDISQADMTISFLPMAHVAEHVAGFLGRINTGMRTSYATSYDTLLDELQEVKPTYFGAVPRIFEKMYGRILERVANANPRRQAIFASVRDLAVRKARADMEGAPFSWRDQMMYRLADRLVYRKIRGVFGGQVKAFVTGAAPIDLEILHFFYGTGMRIIEVYGLSEATAIAFANTTQEQMLGTVGKPLPGIEYKLASDGEILLRGPTVFTGYLNQPEATSEVFNEEGYLCTGDIGEIDENGYLRITDRKKNLLKTAGGKYVVPARLEMLVKREPIIGQVYIHGDRKPYVVACITLDERETERVAEELGVTEAALPTHPEIARRVGAAVEHANGRLARYEQIKRHTILPEDFSIEAGTLTPTMKIKRRVVASQYADVIEGLYRQADEAHSAA